MKSPEELAGVFRSRGYKVTPQRQAVFRALFDNDGHPSAESVHRAVVAEMPTVSLRTVYQTLGDLAAMGEIVQLQLGTGSARFDPNLAPHHHLVCERCGMVRDVAVDHPDVHPTGDHDFEVTGTEIVFRGLCPGCAAQPGGERIPEHHH